MWLLLNLVALSMCTYANTCPDDIVPMQNFELKNFATGRWFEISRYSSFVEEKDADCVYYDFTSNESPFEYTAHEVVNGTTISYSGTIFQPEANIATLYDTLDLYGGKKNMTHTILDSDYATYSLLYYCVFDENKQEDTESAWITSRTPKLNDDAKLAVTKYLDDHKRLDKNNFVWNHFTHEACLLDV